MKLVKGTPVYHGVELDKCIVLYDLGARVGHTLVIGTIRVGKTNLAELPGIQDIRRGVVTVMSDPQGLTRTY